MRLDLRRAGHRVPAVFGLSALALVACTPAISSGGSVDPDDFPRRAVTVMSAFGAGSNADLAARAYAPCIQQELGGEVITQAVEGGTGAVGMNDFTSRPPDGHTYMVNGSSAVLLPDLSSAVEYDFDDIDTLGILQEYENALVVSGDSKYKTFDDFVAAAKSDPEGISIATSGPQTAQFFEWRRMADLYGIEFNLLPVDTAPAIAGVIGGNYDAAFVGGTTSLTEYTDSGDLRALATGGAKRSPIYPDVPTLAESGFPRLDDSTQIMAVMVSKDVPQEIRDMVRVAIDTCKTHSGVETALGNDAVPQQQPSPTDLHARLANLLKVYDDYLR